VTWAAVRAGLASCTLLSAEQTTAAGRSPCLPASMRRLLVRARDDRYGALGFRSGHCDIACPYSRRGGSGANIGRAVASGWQAVRGMGMAGDLRIMPARLRATVNTAALPAPCFHHRTWPYLPAATASLQHRLHCSTKLLRANWHTRAPLRAARLAGDGCYCVTRCTHRRAERARRARF